jgi:hypothetical protein
MYVRGLYQGSWHVVMAQYPSAIANVFGALPLELCHTHTLHGYSYSVQKQDFTGRQTCKVVTITYNPQGWYSPSHTSYSCNPLSNSKR